MELFNITIKEANKLLNEKQITSEELVETFISRIENVDKKIKAYITIDENQALKDGKKADKGIDVNSPLKGVPLAVKDNICTKDLKTTCASKMLEDFIPPYDATVVKKLKDCGAVVLGKTNLDEFAMGSTGKNSVFFRTKNPWNLNRTPGGSSGGSAAAVAAGECVFALGSDTGGSVRQPASFCGVVGLKPTYGRISRFGLTAYASSLDQIGPITKDVTDCAIVMEAISGQDPKDATSSEMPISEFQKSLQCDVKGLKIGIIEEYFTDKIDENVKQAVIAAAKVLEDQGAYCDKVSFSHINKAPWAYRAIALAEAASNMARYDGIRFGYRAEKYEDLVDLYKKSRGEGFGNEVKKRILLGTYLSDFDEKGYYLKAQKVRTLLINEFKEKFKEYDLIIAPTTHTVAYEIGQSIDSTTAHIEDMCTTPANLAGLPAISIPCGFSKGLPIGLQIIGKPFDESTVLRAAYTFEQLTDYHRKHPVIEEE